MFRTTKGREARHHRNTLAWNRHMRRREQSQRQYDLHWENANWDVCLRAFMLTAPATLIHKGRKPRTRRTYGPFD